MTRLPMKRRPLMATGPDGVNPFALRWFEKRYDRNGARLDSPVLSIATPTVTSCTSERFRVAVREASESWNTLPTGVNITIGFAETLTVVVKVRSSVIVGGAP